MGSIVPIYPMSICSMLELRYCKQSKITLFGMGFYCSNLLRVLKKSLTYHYILSQLGFIGERGRSLAWRVARQDMYVAVVAGRSHCCHYDFG